MFHECVQIFDVTSGRGNILGSERSLGLISGKKKLFQSYSCRILRIMPSGGVTGADSVIMLQIEVAMGLSSFRRRCCQYDVLLAVDYCSR
jgi:hypothetical protein